MQEPNKTKPPESAEQESERETLSLSRLLLGGALTGPSHVGNEAALEGVVHIIREIAPQSEIVALTDGGRPTEKRLGIKTLPSPNFTDDPSAFEQAVERFASYDVFVWIGSTGRHTDPEQPLKLIAAAQEAKLPSVIFCADLTPQLHPVYAAVDTKTETRFFETIKFFTAGIMDLRKDRQTKKDAVVRESLGDVMPKVDLIAVCDERTKSDLEGLSQNNQSVHLGVDPAIALTYPDLDTCRIPKLSKDFIEQAGIKIGICFDDSSTPLFLNHIVPLLEALVEKHNARLLGIPMQIAPPSSNLNQIQDKLKKPEAMHVLPHGYAPDEVAAAVSRLDLVLTDQRDLLVLASVSLTPFLGLSNSPSVSAFIDLFGLPKFGDPQVEDVDEIQQEVARLLESRTSFRREAKIVRIQLLKRLKETKRQLEDFLTKTLQT